MSQQSKSVRQQQAAADARRGAARGEADGWVARLRACERLLGQVLSLKGVDICWREAQALKVKLDRQLALAAAELQGGSEAECEAVVEANQKFAVEHLRGFEGENMGWMEC